MRKTCVVVGAVLALLCGAGQAANRCPQPDGKVVYQDTPCLHGDGAKVNLSGAGQPEANLRGERGARIDAAIGRREIMVGMTAAQAIRSWGPPDKVNASIGRYGRHEQWVYDRGNYRSQYVYVENGEVTSVQTSE